ncbi:hypothetical protein [Dokdonella immobilis]|uniref:Uncharacterized protein n=1 Tax=Dokdonella immobilis TaxID=578942 RepID=A0A1I4ZHM9_9GAMM|nr:hypothetical protein [Dokdonella immobilis]SFN49795.1 hypothetical protein SAMN05216289_1268 [Dokdonella immobilis]
MIEDDIYTFKIDAYTPETIPMARLAEYMAVLAEIFGEQGSVHFQKIVPGSVKILSRVEREAVVRVRQNIVSARSGDGRPEGASAFKKTNEMLRTDNAVGDLSLRDDNILEFPGRKEVRPPKLGPFNQGIERDGVIVRVGGRDKSAHVSIESSDKESLSFEVTRELAVRLAPFLYGKPIRLIGSGRFVRNEDGVWTHSALKAHDFVVLNDESLAEVVGRIRVVPGAWNIGDDPIADLRSLRSDEGNIH